MTDRDTAIKFLSSDSVHERRKAAKFFLADPSAKDVQILRVAYQQESDWYVKRRLEDAMRQARSKLPKTEAGAAESMDVFAEVRRESWVKAVEWVSGLILHEIERKLGPVRAAAAEEIQNFTESNTKKKLDALDRVFEGVKLLRRAAGTPRIEEVDVAQLILDVIAEENANRVEYGKSTMGISFVGKRPYLIPTDRRLLELPVSNGIRNAMEAIDTVGAPPADHSIVVTLGETDVDYRISILDHGPGLRDPAEVAFRIGTSTKVGHIGFGLAITQQVMTNLGGEATLETARDGGALLELRWKK